MPSACLPAHSVPSAMAYPRSTTTLCQNYIKPEERMSSVAGNGQRSCVCLPWPGDSPPALGKAC